MIFIVLLNSLAWGLSLGAEQSAETISSSGSITRSSDSMVVVALDGSGDYTNIQTAMNNLPAGPVTLYIKEGTYTLGSGSGSPAAQILARSDLTIRGDGIGKTIIRRSSTSQGNSNLDMIGTREGTPVRNFVLEDLTLDGMYIDQGNSGGSCIIFSHNQNTVHKNIIIRRVEAKNSRAGFNSRNIIGSSWDDYGLIIEDCIFTHSSTGMTFANTAWVIIRNNRIEYTSIDAILPDSTSAYLGGGGDGACHHFIVEYNYCKDVGDTGIDFTAHTARGDARHSDMTARFNILVTARVRISGTDGAVFSDNVIYNKDPLPSGFPSNAGLYREGISCDAGESGSTNVEVSRNKVQPGVGRGSDRSIRFEETRNLVCRDNVIYGEGAWDITYYSVSGTQSIGGNQKTSGDMPAEYYE